MKFLNSDNWTSVKSGRWDQTYMGIVDEVEMTIEKNSIYLGDEALYEADYNLSARDLEGKISLNPEFKFANKDLEYLYENLKSKAEKNEEAEKEVIAERLKDRRQRLLKKLA